MSGSGFPRARATYLRRARSGWAWALAGMTLAAGALWQITAPNGDLYQYRCFALAFWRGSAGVPHAAGCAGRLPAGVYPAFHVLPREYPPLAVIPFSAPLLLGGLINLTLYALAFNVLMALCLGATAGLIGRIGVSLGAPNARLAQRLYLLWLALGATTIALVRFDALPALLTVVALALALHPQSGALWSRYTAYAPYALLAAGALLKLYPALFIPLLAAWDWRRRKSPDLGVVGNELHTANSERRAGLKTGGTMGRRASRLEAGGTMGRRASRLEAGGTAAGGTAGGAGWTGRQWVWLGGPLLAAGVAVVAQGVADLVAGVDGVGWLSVQGRRPPQIESTAAGLLWLWQVALGQGAHIHAVSVQRSASFVEAPGRALATATLALALLAIAWAFIAIAAGALPPLRGIAGATLALLGGAAIFSPQYLLWATPLVALAVLALPPGGERSAEGVGGRAVWRGMTRRTLLMVGLWSGVCVGTTIIYSVGYLLGWPAHTGGVLAGFMLLVLARDTLVWVCAGLLLWPATHP